MTTPWAARHFRAEGSSVTPRRRAPFLYSRRNSPGTAVVGLREAFSRPEAPMIRGMITTRDVLLHAPIIVGEFGAAIWLRCCLVALRRRPTTFLECIFSSPQVSAA